MIQRIATAVLALLLTALPALAELPEPASEPTDMILGETRGVRRTEAVIYYKALDGTELTAVRRTLEVPEGETVVQAALEELLSPRGTSNVVSVAPGDAEILGIETARGFVTVNLSVDIASIQSDQELLMMIAAISNTLLSLSGVTGVNVLIDSRQESAFGLPTGVTTASEGDVTVLAAQYQVEEERFLGTEESAVELTRTVALYFPSVNGQWVLPELRRVSFQDADYAAQLLDELIAGSSGGSAYASFLSGGVSVLAAEPQLYVTSAGERVLDVYLTGALRDFLILQGISEWQMAAAIALTMTTFIPELDAVSIYIDGTALTQLNVRGNLRSFSDGLLRRADFAPYIGGVAPIYFSDGQGGLIKVERAMSARRAQSAYSLILQLISGPSSSETGAHAVMPLGATADDLLGVSIADGVAAVNFSANFYRLCQTLDAADERTLVYAIVNTLCEMPDVNAVSILIEGERVETLANDIYLKSDLMPNPGMVNGG